MSARRADGLCVGSIALCALVLHRDGLFGGPAFYERDTQIFYYPLAAWVAEQLHAGSYPLWLPGIFTGYPIFADGELGLAYLPQVLLLFALPTPMAMVWLRVLHAFLAGLFTYVFLRTLRVDPLPGLGGALVFAFGSFLSAQMHHENVVRSSVWLPLVLTCLELGMRQPSVRRSLVWLGFGALAFSQSALGLHIQPVLMLALAAGGYSLFRASSPWMGWKVGILRLVSAPAAVAGGLVVAAVQWVPLGEWALVSSRRSGVDYEFGSAFGLAPENLPSVIFPFFFRLGDATTWWTLWQQWETELYVGIPTLALIVVGMFFGGRRELLYFVGLGVLSLLIGMAHYAPLVNLHLLLWSLPGFSFLRAPGRFGYLIVFACACTAAFGLQALSTCGRRRRIAILGGVPPIALAVGLGAVFPFWRSWLAADPDRARAFVDSTYLATRAQYPIDPALVVSGLLTSLDLATPKTAWSLVLLGLTGIGFGAWLGLGPRRASVAQGLLVGLMAIDVLVFAYDFHPRAPLPSLKQPDINGIGAGERVLLHGVGALPEFEPNQLLPMGLESVEGYSSLPSQRHVELYAQTEVQPTLFDVWSGRYFIEPLHPPDLHVAGGLAFRSDHPIAAGFGGAPPSRFEVPVDPVESGMSSAVRLIGTLSYAFDVPQGTQVASLELVDDHGQLTQLPIRAGLELAERAYDRPSLHDLVQHQRPSVALDFEESTPEGEEYQAHLYQADLLLPRPVRPRSISLIPTHPRVLTEVHGLGLIESTSGAVQPIELANREGFHRVDDRVIELGTALPRAFVIPREQAFSLSRHPNLTSVQLVGSPDFDPHRSVLIEGDPNLAPEPLAVDQSPAPADVRDLGSNAVEVTASVDRPSYLVLDDFYHRGWTARVDGQPARVLIANAVFRAVAVEPGQHMIRFEFAPLSHQFGALASILSVIGVVGLILYGRNRAGHRLQL